MTSPCCEARIEQTQKNGPICTECSARLDPELAMQERTGPLGNAALEVLAFTFFLIPSAVLAFLADGCINAWRWLKLRRACAWCQRRLGGNPIARHTTSGICGDCREKMTTDH